MPRRLVHAPLLAVGGTAEALPFPKPFVRQLYAGKYCFWKLENFRALASETVKTYADRNRTSMSGELSMKSQCLPFQQIPQSARLLLDYLSYLPSVPHLYPRDPLVPERVKAEPTRDVSG